MASLAKVHVINLIVVSNYFWNVNKLEIKQQEQ